LQLSLDGIAHELGGEVIGDETVTVTGVNSLGAAGPNEISFFADRRYKEVLTKTRAAALIVARKIDDFKGPQVVVSNPELAYAKVASLFAPPLPRFPGISERAFVHERSRLGENVSIYPTAYVGENAELGDNVTIFPGVFVGDRVKVGNGTVIYPNVTILQDCVIGKNVIIHAGTVIGSDGFGYARDGATSVKIPQIGIVQIDDDVEIGANNCLDRAALGKTWIKRGVKTDNLVQIAHNVVIGEDSIVISQTGISGSVHIGRQVIIAGQVGIIDHVNIGDGAMIGPQSGIAKSVGAGEVVSGTPSMPHRLWLKTTGLITRLPQLSERLRHLERKVEAIRDSFEKD
jgi:UDP-3-O-[3-hydroxymyristoyl] glucosamine N-acyltransferase